MNITAILSGHTCGEACWYAKEEICRCACNGKNHGILTLANGQKPERFCIHNRVQYKLAGVGTWSQMRHQEYEICEQAFQHSLTLSREQRLALGNSERCPAAYIQNATKTQQKWIEVANFPGDDTPVLLWVKAR